MCGTRIFRALFPFSLLIIAIPVIAMIFIQFQDCCISSSSHLECLTNLVSSLSWYSRVKQWQDVNHEEFKKRYEEMESSFRVFVYPEGDPKTYYQTPGVLSGPYASEGYFFKNIMESPLRTENPDEATMFFIPISVQKMSAKVYSFEQC
ncbi:hypothetical protein SLEP1_g14759 [Rubroshorea leprosula]|uniref:Exostosin GT47 domain-containing protein n=1 Tax=Rubroshorea leprosula TaxID=152421 RepID=A0AAV5IPI3_9ROSI|nr:hypothetical protein SLEP1_g14759 [Rubroshorea leprosula]